MNTEVRLIENFCSFQGEGPDLGRAMVILRCKTCNLDCPWCDTKVKMRISNEANYSLQELQDIIDQKKVGVLVTGGEPTVGKHIDDSVAILNELNYLIANVETNGYNLEGLISRVDLKKSIKFIYSPKIFSEEDLELAITKTKDFLSFRSVYFKIVYEDVDLIHTYLEMLSSLCGYSNEYHRVYLMPEGSTREELIERAGKVFNACEKYKFNFSTRSHIIYGFV